MEWPDIYRRLHADPNDVAGWSALEARVRLMARDRLGNLGYDAVEDALADTCASVLLDLDAARGSDTFSGFVRGKLWNVVKGVQRTAALRRTWADEVQDVPAPPSDDGYDSRYAILDRCLERLPPRDRRAVELRYFEQARAERIASELDVTEGNARRIVFNGVNRLRKCAQASVVEYRLSRPAV
ncbi:MAG: sigma-70 family RNA polymerase sigma factor [Chloroflexi bacterium]|nr:sigma-70 family RNA polymerase sigma factor [Chloroflexota bacterium]